MRLRAVREEATKYRQIFYIASAALIVVFMVISLITFFSWRPQEWQVFFNAVGPKVLLYTVIIVGTPFFINGLAGTNAISKILDIEEDPTDLKHLAAAIFLVGVTFCVTIGLISKVF